MSAPHKHHEDVLKRLRRAAGHLERVISMIEKERPCAELAQQLQAVHGAIGNAKNVLIRDHIEHCIDPATVRDVSKARAMVAELRAISKYL